MATASLAESAQLTGTVLAPLVARGLLARRPRVVALEARFDADRRAVRLLQRLRARHGDEALLVPIPRRRGRRAGPDRVPRPVRAGDAREAGGARPLPAPRRARVARPGARRTAPV